MDVLHGAVAPGDVDQRVGEHPRGLRLRRRLRPLAPLGVEPGGDGLGEPGVEQQEQLLPVVGAGCVPAGHRQPPACQGQCDVTVVVVAQQLDPPLEGCGGLDVDPGHLGVADAACPLLPPAWPRWLVAVGEDGQVRPPPQADGGGGNRLLGRAGAPAADGLGDGGEVVEDLLEQRRLRRVYEPLDAAGLVGDLLPAAGVEDQLVVDPYRQRLPSSHGDVVLRRERIGGGV